MILHRVAHDIGDFDEASVVLILECMQDTTLDRLETIGYIGNGPFADDIGGILQKVEIDQISKRPVLVMHRDMIMWRWGFIITAAGGFHCRSCR